MKIWAILTLAIVGLLLVGDAESRKSGGGSRRTGGWGFGSKSSRTTPRPRPSQTHYQQPQGTGGSTPDKIGWNVPPKNTQTAAKPSAPVSETLSKSSATNVHSGYSPSGGYPRQPASNPYNVPGTNSQPGAGYNPSVGGHSPYGGQAYNPSSGAGAHPSYAQGYNPPSMGQPYHPQGHYNPGGGQAYNPSYGSPYSQPHNPSFGSPYSPTIGQMPQQTILLQSGQSRPGIGQLAKEAFVFAGVSAGVNAAVNRIIPGGIYGHRSDVSSAGASGAAGPAGGTHTSITYNNYYNNGTAPVPGTDQAAAPANNPQSPPAGAPPAAPAPPAEPAQTAQSSAPNNNAPPAANDAGMGNSNDQNNNPNPLGYVTSNDDLKKLTESLYEKDANNANRFVAVNLQGQKKDESSTDDASEPLLSVQSEAYEIPTIKAVLALHDNYEMDVRTKESVTSEERREEAEFLDKVLETEVMKLTMKFLAEKGYIPDDEYEFKDSLKRIWFSQFKRIDGDASSSGFETVFLAEKFDSDIIGLHNWIYYAKQEEANKLNYLGYIKQLTLGTKGSILKVRSSLNDVVQPVTSIFVGTSPELELALYTMCFFTRPNNACPVSLGGADFLIIANRVNYFGKDILIAAYPEII